MQFGTVKLETRSCFSGFPSGGDQTVVRSCLYRFDPCHWVDVYISLLEGQQTLNIDVLVHFTLPHVKFQVSQWLKIIKVCLKQWREEQN